MLSEIKGAGKVSVMIMYDGGVEYVTANSSSVTTNKTTDNSGGVDRITENTTETSTPIIINENGQSKPIIIKEIMPNITGVMIIAEGANDVSVRMELMRAAATILDVNSNIIEVFTRKK
jgi:stage III sporulation protein AG